MVKNFYRKKPSLIFPIVIGIALIYSAGLISTGFIKRQITYYTTNFSSIIDAWMKEGIDRLALEKTIRQTKLLNGKLTSSIIAILTPFLLRMGTVALIDCIDINKILFFDILEGVSIFLFDALFACKLYIGLISSAYLPALFSLLLFAAFYFFTKKTLRWIEQVFIISLYAPFIFNASMVYLGDPGSLSFGKSISVVEYEEMSETLRKRIVDVAATGKVRAENIRVLLEKKSINAMAARGLRFKYIFITEGAVNVLSDDQLLTFVYHEVGHIIHNHTIIGTTIILVSRGSIVLLIMFLYREVAFFYNGFVSWTLAKAIWKIFDILHTHVYNVQVKYRQELEADHNSYSQKGYLIPHIEGEKILALMDEGIMFDYKKYMGHFFTHPSSYTRIKIARKYGEAHQ
ncbi:hypothetical protein PAEPH01_0404 [Pancytospora epiphaga]|nr:hypothetical protein PAEPH01_0404 [Pancytospora epiphaga]